ncbi:ankyrin repeat-containing protein At5g02620-like [Macadamia integrifolia]|uniref:ankyrin repeat-containing protein At5g02620-like n=1 Tax=Macadamia integrifolia TaxID=60698 RepID=UPI001C53398B|nr:ankyrin repeat-containing protein At5g02620-like [Macadamia integrifolia]
MKRELYNAVVEGDIGAIRRFESSDRLQVTSLENTILHVAVQIGSARSAPYETKANIEAICNLCPSSLIGRANSDGDTLLHIAARGGRYDIVEVLISKYSDDIEIGSLLKMVNLKKDTALHEALKNRHLFDWTYQKEYLEVVKILIKNEPELSNFINEASHESPVFIAAREGLLDFLNVLMNSCCSEYGGPAKMTALHAAVLLREDGEKKDFLSAQKGGVTRKTVFEIITKLMKSKPALIEEEDEFKLTPLHYAANLNSDEKIKDSHERVKMLLDPSLVGDHTSVVYHSDKNGMTALHYAALRGNTLSMDALIQCCPDCFEQIDNRGRTTLHFAVKAGSDATIKYMITKNANLSSISKFMVNKCDKNGDTPLHLAAKIPNLDALRFLVDRPEVDKRALNKDNLTALDILKAKGIDDILEKKSLVGNLKSKTGRVSSQAPRIAKNNETQPEGGEDEKGSPKIQDPNSEGQDPKKKDKEDIGQIREIQLLVATLIATVSFAASFTMPGGYNGDGPDQGMAALNTKAAFQAFVISNTLAMALSTSAIFIHFNATTTGKFIDLKLSTNKAAKFIVLANTGMVVAFVCGTYLVLANNKPLAISTTVLGCLFFLVVGGKLLTNIFKYCISPIFCNKCWGVMCFLCCCFPICLLCQKCNKKEEKDKDKDKDKDKEKPVEEKNPSQSPAEDSK